MRKTGHLALMPGVEYCWCDETVYVDVVAYRAWAGGFNKVEDNVNVAFGILRAVRKSNPDLHIRQWCIRGA